jgi:hypothetical protein
MSGTLAACLLRTWPSNANRCRRAHRTPPPAGGSSASRARRPTRRGRRHQDAVAGRLRRYRGRRPLGSRLQLTANPSIPSGDEGLAGNGPFSATSRIRHPACPRSRVARYGTPRTRFLAARLRSCRGLDVVASSRPWARASSPRPCSRGVRRGIGVRAGSRSAVWAPQDRDGQKQVLLPAVENAALAPS